MDRPFLADFCFLLLSLSHISFSLSLPTAPLLLFLLPKGWDASFISMQVGEKAKITIKGDYAYGPDGIPGVIPPNATLVFDVEMLEIRKGK